MWQSYQRGYESWLRLEKGLAENTIRGYLADLRLLLEYFEQQQLRFPPSELRKAHLQQFIEWVTQENEFAALTRARLLSSLRSFCTYLVLEEVLETNPTELLQGPKLEKKLPDVLEEEETINLIDAARSVEPFGIRNTAILEVLYSCGMRVSELTTLRLSDLFFEDGLLRVIGKGSKQRFIPAGEHVKEAVELYLRQRIEGKISPKHRDIVFLSRNGNALSRVMVFNIVKQAAQAAGIKKKVSPHTLRHCFATHLMKGGANLRAVQEMLGHASITTTEIYTHLDRQHLQRVIERFHPRHQ